MAFERFWWGPSLDLLRDSRNGGRTLAGTLRSSKYKPPKLVTQKTLL